MRVCLAGGLLCSFSSSYDLLNAQPCHQVLSVKSAIQRRAQLDGAVVCVSGWVYALPFGKAGVFFRDVVPVGAKRGQATYRIGTVTWATN